MFWYRIIYRLWLEGIIDNGIGCLRWEENYTGGRTQLYR